MDQINGKIKEYYNKRVLKIRIIYEKSPYINKNSSMIFILHKSLKFQDSIQLNMMIISSNKKTCYNMI